MGENIRNPAQGEGGGEEKKQQIRLHQPAQLRWSDRACLGLPGDGHKGEKPKSSVRSLRNDDRGLYVIVAIVTSICQAHHPVCVIGLFYFVESTPAPPSPRAGKIDFKKKTFKSNLTTKKEDLFYKIVTISSPTPFFNGICI